MLLSCLDFDIFSFSFLIFHVLFVKHQKPLTLCNLSKLSSQMPRRSASSSSSAETQHARQVAFRYSDFPICLGCILMVVP